MSFKIEVTLSPQKKRIFINCPFALNSAVKKVPAVKFEKSMKIWTASFSMQNIKFFGTELRRIGSLFSFDEETKALIEKRQVEILDLVPKNKLPFPPTVQFTHQPYPFQKDALDFISDMNIFALFMDMGLGKSFVTLYKFLKEVFAGKVNTLIVICPTSLRRNWLNEINKFMPENFRKGTFINVLDLRDNSALKRIDADKLKKGMHILIAGVEALQVGEKKGRAYDIITNYVLDKNYMLFVDESSDIKTIDSNRTANCIHIGEKAKIRGIGTGTEISNSILDLYPQFQFLHPDIIGIGSMSAFKARYVEFGGFQDKQIIGYKNIEEIFELIRPYVFKRTTAESGLDLPETSYQIRTLEMTDYQKTTYLKIKKEKEMYIRAIDSTKLIESVVDAYNKLQQVVGGFLIYETGEVTLTQKQTLKIVKDTERLMEISKNPKINETLKIARENPDKSIIIWAKFTEEVNMLMEALTAEFGVDCCSRFDGEVGDADREISKQNFLNTKSRFFVAKASSGGKGLTLNISDLVIYFSNSFKYIDREQSKKRNHRIGQTKNVTYIDLVMEKTIDGKILESLEEKRNLADFVKERLSDGVGDLLT